MPVEAVVDDVEFAAREPLKVGFRGPLKGGLPGFEPVKFFGEVIPEFVTMFQRPRVECLVDIEPFGLHICRDIGICNSVRRWWENTFFRKKSVGVFKTEVCTHKRIILFASLSSLHDTMTCFTGEVCADDENTKETGGHFIFQTKGKTGCYSISHFESLQQLSMSWRKDQTWFAS